MKRVIGFVFIGLSIWQYSEGSNHSDNGSYLAFGTIFLLIGAVLILVGIMNKEDENINTQKSVTPIPISIPRSRPVVDMDTIQYIKDITKVEFENTMLNLMTTYDIDNNPGIPMIILLEDYRQAKIVLENKLLNDQRSSQILLVISRESILNAIKVSYDQILHKYIQF